MHFNLQDFLFTLAEYVDEIREALNKNHYRIAEYNTETGTSRWLTKNLLFSLNYLEGGIFLEEDARKIANNLSNRNSDDAKLFYLEPTYTVGDLTP